MPKPDDGIRQRRIDSRGPLERPDTFEMRDRSFQWRVNEGYHTIAAKYNIPRIDLVDKVSRHEKSIEEVHAEIMELIWLRELLPRREK